MEQATGEFRLARQGGGRGAYAHVRVEARPATPGGEVVWAVDPGDQASAQPSRDPELVEAALDGVREAAQQIGVNGWDLSIVYLGMNLADTEPTAVRAAAGAATAAALGHADRYEVAYDNRWVFRPVGPA